MKSYIFMLVHYTSYASVVLPMCFYTHITSVFLSHLIPTYSNLFLVSVIELYLGFLYFEANKLETVTDRSFLIQSNSIFNLCHLTCVRLNVLLGNYAWHQVYTLLTRVHRESMLTTFTLKLPCIFCQIMIKCTKHSTILNMKLSSLWKPKQASI